MIATDLQAGRYDYIGLVAELKKSEYWVLLMRAYGELRTEFLYKSRTHGMTHIERVMLLGAIIAMQQGFSARETELLLIACSYHDIGRRDDSADKWHGKRGADYLPLIPLPEISKEELRCVQTAIATHSARDSLIDSFAEEYGVGDEDIALCRLLCKALKDADNLDRVRIHDLNTNRLRFAESKKMKPTAEAIYYQGKAIRAQERQEKIRDW